MGKVNPVLTRQQRAEKRPGPSVSHQTTQAHFSEQIEQQCQGSEGALWTPSFI